MEPSPEAAMSSISLPHLHLPQGPSEDETVDITAKAAVGFVFLASGMLLFIFFLFNKFFFYVLLVLFCVAAAQVWAWIQHP